MRVVSNLPGTPTARRLRLAFDADAAFSFRAGQALGLRLDAADFTPYSIATAPHEAAQRGELEFLVKVDGANRFGARVAQIAPGVLVEVNAPFGRFTLPEGPLSDHGVYVAGGTGVAPLRSMIVEAHARAPSIRMALLYSARTAEEFAYLEDFRALERRGVLALSLTVTGPDERWPHTRGRASRTHLADLVTPQSNCYLCGPIAMVADLRPLLESLGVPRAQIFTEDW